MNQPIRTVYNNEMRTNPIVSSYPSQTTPGVLNNIKRTTTLLNLNLNSCYRSNYYSSSPSNYQYIFPAIINNVVSLRLASIEIPNSWYLFSSKAKNNFFNIKVNTGEEYTDFLIVIPEGNYSSEQLEIYLNQTYFYASSTDSYLKKIKFSIDPISLKSRFELLNTNSIFLDDETCEMPAHGFSLFFLENELQNVQNTAGWILGFRMPVYHDIQINIQSEGIFDGAGDKYIYFSLNDYQYNYSTTNTIFFSDSVLSDYILAKIPIVNGKLSLSVYDNQSPLNKVRFYNGIINLNRITVKLYDKFGNIIDLNNMDYSFTLEVETLYENFNFSNINK